MTTCPDVRRWIHDELKERLPGSVRVTRSEPLNADRAAEAVWLGDSTAASTRAHGLGPAPIHMGADYTTAVVFVCSTRTDAAAAEDRVFEMFAALQALLVETPKPEIVGLLHLILRRWEFTSEVPEGTPAVKITAMIEAAEHT